MPDGCNSTRKLKLQFLNAFYIKNSFLAPDNDLLEEVITMGAQNNLKKSSHQNLPKISNELLSKTSNTDNCMKFFFLIYLIETIHSKITV